MRLVLRRVPACLVWLALFGAPVRGQDRLIQRLTAVGAVQIGSVRSLAQDSAGYLWIGTVGGLLRWDGQELRRWAPEQLDSWVNGLTVCPDGTVYAAQTLKGISAIDRHGAHQVAPHIELSNPDAGSVACDATGQLWVTGDREVWRRRPDGHWMRTDLPAPSDPSPFFMHGPPGTRMIMRC